MRQLMISPAIDAYQPRDEALRYTRTQWNDGRVDKGRVIVRYLHDCTAPGDRILVTGLTPFQVGYYTERRIAGGHLYWHHGWRSDSTHEAQSLELLQKASVPFVFSTADPILQDFARYPRIREYLASHYVALDGTEGRVLIEKDRHVTGSFGALAFPCFQ
jgi:hypothetical protein